MLCFIFRTFCFNVEFETTKEFAAMTLSHLCLEYAGIYELIEHKCFSVIIPCLKSPDPDVQKNTLDIIHMLLQVLFEIFHLFLKGL